MEFEGGSVESRLRSLHGRMRITPPTMPHHLAKAYGVSPVAKASPVRASEAAARVGVQQAAGGSEAIRKLVAGVVPGGIDFSSAEPTPSAPAMAFYRHPADQNAAATGVLAGRVLDLEG